MKKFLLSLAALSIASAAMADSYWQLVESDADLAMDATYVIACNSKSMLMTSEIAGTSGSYMKNEAIPTNALSDDQKTLTELSTNTALVKFSGDDFTAVKVEVLTQDETSKGFLYTNVAKKLWLKTSATDATSASVSVTNGTADIKFGTYGSIYYNASSPRFLNYANALIAIQLYKLVESGEEDTRLEAGLEFAEKAYEADMAAAFNAPSLVNPNNVDCVWSSSNPNVADFEEGVLTLKGTGTTTIQAKFDGDDQVKAGWASYDLTVVNSLATDHTFDFISAQVSETSFEGGKVKVEFSKGNGGTNPTGYANGLRMYAKNTATISAQPGYVIEKVVFETASAWLDGGLQLSAGTYDADTKTWTPAEGVDVNNFSFVNGPDATKGNTPVQKIHVYWKEGKATFTASFAEPLYFVEGAEETLTAVLPAGIDTNKLLWEAVAEEGEPSTGDDDEFGLTPSGSLGIWGDGASVEIITNMAGVYNFKVTYTGDDTYALGSVEFAVSVYPHPTMYTGLEHGQVLSPDDLDPDTHILKIAGHDEILQVFPNMAFHHYVQSNDQPEARVAAEYTRYNHEDGIYLPGKSGSLSLIAENNGVESPAITLTYDGLPTGVTVVTLDGQATYYTLQGVKVENPETNGIYVRVEEGNSKVVKN